MAKVNFIGADRSIEAAEGTTLAECIRLAGFFLETPCNCSGLCGKCKVKAWGELAPACHDEQLFRDKERPELRVACLARVMGNVDIQLLESEASLNTINRGYAIDVPIQSSIQKVSLPEPDKKTSGPYLDQLGYSLSAKDLFFKAGQLEKQDPGVRYGVVWGQELLDLGESCSDILGVAIDIGTTGISAYLVNLENGQTIHKVSALNPQTEFGGDVLSRITYCLKDPEGTRTLQEVILKKIDQLIVELVQEITLREHIYWVIIAGNTTMLHFVMGAYPGSIAKAPYRPVFLDRIDLKARELGMNINENGLVTLLPSASGYVGADIIAGVAATAFDEIKHPALFIDIGTNGEIVLNAQGKLLATSTAAGPALEGMNISCGCRAEKGALDSFLMAEDLSFTYTTIGELPPKGICGSGLIDLTAQLVAKGIILSSGRFTNNPDPRLKDNLLDKKFIISDNLSLTQKDIRQIQLAKGAIAAGITMLLYEAGIAVEDIEEAVIAGAFGYHLNPESLTQIGLLPKGFRGKISFVGNSSVEGARLALINADILQKMTALKNKIEVVELSTKAKFQDYFVKALSF